METLIEQAKNLAELQAQTTEGNWRVQQMGNRLEICTGEGEGKYATPICHVHKNTQGASANAAFFLAAQKFDFAALAASPAAPATGGAGEAAKAVACLLEAAELLNGSGYPEMAGNIKWAANVLTPPATAAAPGAGETGILKQMQDEFAAFEPATDVVDPQFREGVRTMRRYMNQWIELALMEATAPPHPATPVPTAATATDGALPIADCPYDVPVLARVYGEYVPAVRWQAPADGDPSRKEWFFSPLDTDGRFDLNSEPFDADSVDGWKPLPAATATGDTQQ